LCAALTGRTHGCTDQPANVKKSLANSEHANDTERCLLSGAKRTYRDGDLMRSWFADHAAMRLEEAPAGAARRDRSIKWEFLILQF
jgi:hypothetical protein